MENNNIYSGHEPVRWLSLRHLSQVVVNSKFVNRWFVFAFDVLASTFATTITYTIIGYFINSPALVFSYLNVVLISLVASASAFLIFGTYRGILRYTSSQEIWKLSVAVFSKCIILFGLFAALDGKIGFTIDLTRVLIVEFLDIVATMSVLVFTRVVLVYIYNLSLSQLNRNKINVLIYDDGDKSVFVANYLANTHWSKYNVCGYVKITNTVAKHILSGIKVYSVLNMKFLAHIVEKRNIHAIVFPTQISAATEKDRVVEFAIKHDVKVLLFPPIDEINNGANFKASLKEINVEDLLGRDEIEINMDKIKEFIEGKRVMVTGAAGSIGSELCRLISGFNIKRLIMLDSAETPMHNLMLEFDKIVKRHNSEMEEQNDNPESLLDDYKDRFTFIIGDVRSRIRIEKVFDKERPQIIFHAAAYKHVPMMELNPCEAIGVNVQGTMIVADNAVKYGTEKMIMISTDKAVNPTNVMGASKRIAEIYVQSLSRAIVSGEVKGSTKFITTRFGNVLGSNGSVIPRFKDEIANGGPVTVTHKDIVRYFMSIPEACRLVLEAATMGEGYEIFVFDMGRPVKIADMAKNMIRLAGYEPDVDIKIEYTGLRPGEKLYEELLNTKENTIATSHKKIFKAKVREFPYDQVVKNLDELRVFARQMEIVETVKKMKEIVPEYKSRNSVFEQLDKAI
ncbi:MAG TPA: nucleoside-diphosphate sugar epimerase/dehydratase [Candidatus Egerieousia sp.]|nr:nucleoside-diphosphate sugar epimerase/dehydratase [Candidatus Egerieousia sp.]